MSPVAARCRGAAPVARELLRALRREPAGQVSPSVYETGRLVSLAPWLAGHRERVAYLLAGQRADGGWGGPQGYALVPTLSAVEALLAEAAATPAGSRHDRLAHAADRGLALLAGTLLPDPTPVPDTPAVDLIVPDLLRRITTRLAARPDAGPPADLPLPAGIGVDRYAVVRRLLRAGAGVPEKLLHAYETVAADAPRPAVPPNGSGTVGASPAATAAWLGGPGAGGPAAGWLAGVAAAGPVPCTSPVTVFERSWVLGQLYRAGIPLAVPAGLLAGLAAALGPRGAATAPGLPPDTDTTAVVLYALARAGRPASPDCLAGYDLGDHFCTWPGEDGASVTTNAHVLEALGWYARHGSPGHTATLSRLTGWLADRQLPDGRWDDRWHASPYYATSCVVLALSRYVAEPRVAAAVERAVDWVLDSQREDGSWGRFTGTVEETAYALHVLLGRSVAVAGRAATAVDRALVFLCGRSADDGPALWHDKDLYRPGLIVRAAGVAAVHLARTAVATRRAGGVRARIG
jgi:hypothetical protein